jgi:hypothetical protein
MMINGRDGEIMTTSEMRGSADIKYRSIVGGTAPEHLYGVRIPPL